MERGLLNKPGRVTLVNSVLTSLPAYHMQIQWFPSYVCDYLDKVSCGFIWKGWGGQGLHMVGWHHVTKKRKHKGIRVRITHFQNIVMLCKLVLEFLQGSQKLWVRLLTSKYVNNNNFFMACTKPGSNVWNAI
uniref:Ribonuclease H protein At1g65750 family n=1 Tax=Cajanus cajan TaxID=3821 RepID=A0A151RNS8_CAJCA|nr:Putative ribonuclease H protein At1g65750 family [Cajanus cajan]